MSFTDKDKRALVEVVNHIQRAYSSDAAFKESEPGKITLPCRLVVLSAETLKQTYDSQILNSLDETELELLIISLLKTVNTLQGSLDTLIKTLPEKLPAGIVEKLKQQVNGLQAMKSEHETLSVAHSLTESSKKILDEKQELDKLRGEERNLLAAREALSDVNLDELRNEVARLEAEIGPSRREMELLQSSVADKTAELGSITTAISDAFEVLNFHETRVGDQLEKVVDLSPNLVAALERYLTRCDGEIRKAAEAIAEKTTEAQRLKTELEARIAEVGEAFAETGRLAGALRIYAESNHRVARNVPTVINLTKEKLSRIEDQLREIDTELKRALDQHQNAKHTARMARV